MLNTQSNVSRFELLCASSVAIWAPLCSISFADRNLRSGLGHSESINLLLLTKIELQFSPQLRP